MDGLTSQNVMPVDGEGKALKKMVLESLPVLGVYFQILEATYENDLDFAIPVFRLGTHSDKNEEDGNDRVGTNRGIRAARYDGCWNCRTLKVIVAILKFILWQTGNQCKSEKTDVMWPNFSVTTRASVF